jgi:hypothetical protein
MGAMKDPKTKSAVAITADDPINASVASAAEDLDALLQMLSAADRDRIGATAARAKESAARPPMTVVMADGQTKVGFGLPQPDNTPFILLADFGTTDPAFFNGVVGQIAQIGSRGQKVDEGNSNFLFSVARAIQPRDELETMLALQTGAIHAATMTMARRLNLAESLPQIEAAERALNKLARTYTVQIEALKRYRTGGQQRVIVEHVTVNAGGQAIVGAVMTGGGVKE